MNQNQIFEMAFIVGTWVVTGWVTLMVMKVRLEAWMDRTKKLEDWKEKAEAKHTNHEVRITLLENK